MSSKTNKTKSKPKPDLIPLFIILKVADHLCLFFDLNVPEWHYVFDCTSVSDSICPEWDENLCYVTWAAAAL